QNGLYGSTLVECRNDDGNHWTTTLCLITDADQRFEKEQNRAMRSGSRSFKVGQISVQIAVYVALTLLSRQSVIGQDHLQRPIALFLLLYFAAWASFLPASIAVLRTPEIYSVRLVLTVAFLLRLLLLPSNLIQESDVYRYVLDGQALLHRQNPYQYPPRTVEE